MDDHATGRAQACCKAGPSSNLGSAPQRGSPRAEPTAMKKMEMRKIISYLTVMKIEEKNVWNICFVLYCLFVAKLEK